MKETSLKKSEAAPREKKKPVARRAASADLVEETAADELYSNVRKYIATARTAVYVVANAAMVEAYWNVGREIVERQGGAGRAAYGDGLIDSLSAKLTTEFGPGYTRSNLRNMRQFYLLFPNRHTVCGKLTWSHYRTLITVGNDTARQWYFDECVKAKWSVRDLQRQISTQFYERLLHNHVPGGTSSAAVPKRSAVEPRDIVRSPAILEFAGIAPGDYSENDLQRALVRHLGKFLLELGRGFCLEREQRPIPIGRKTYHCDLVFYNYLARCFVLIDLKVGEVTPEDIGQMQLYKHWYEREMMQEGDNPPIGIVLGSERDDAVIRYTLNEHERNLFAVKYHLFMPTDEELRLELQRERAAIEEAMALRRLPAPPDVAREPSP